MPLRCSAFSPCGSALRPEGHITAAPSLRSMFALRLRPARAVLRRSMSQARIISEMFLILRVLPANAILPVFRLRWIMRTAHTFDFAERRSRAARFSAFPLHPTEAGADICCDSAHKTLPVLTGGAYLHISRNAPKGMTEKAKAAFSVFGSSSPSYLLLQSLDAFNASAENFAPSLRVFFNRLRSLKRK